jgi:thiamine biosynthesis lipoprotein
MKKIMILTLLLMLITITGCQKENIVFKTYYLDEAFSIVPIVTIIDYEDKIYNLDIENDLNQIIQKLNKKFNVFDETSMITKVNNNSGVISVDVDDEFIYVLETAINISKETKLYDVTTFSVWKEWGFEKNYYQYGNYACAPSDEIIKQKLPLVNYENIIINKKVNQVFLKEKGMMIDLGSIVKGYAADKVSAYLVENEIHNALINIGGNIITMGKNIGTKKNWKAGVLMPYSYDTEIGYVLTNNNKETLVTSGIYERFIVSKNYQTGEETVHHHILNPTTGYPENNDLVSVTIITKESIIADALSTAVFLMGLNKGLEFINKQENIEAIFITKNKEIYLSKNIKDRFIYNEEIQKYNYSLIL